MSMSYNTRWENELIELKALMKTEEIDGYGATKIHSSREICQGWYDIVDRYGFDREVVPVSWNYFCRYISKTQGGGSGPLTPERLQRLILTSLRLAIKKIHSDADPGLAEARVTALSSLGRGREVLDMEMDMLRALDWRVNPPTMQQFAAKLIGLHPLGKSDAVSADYLYEVTRYQVELAVFFSDLMMNYRPSVIAFAAILRAEDQLDWMVLNDETREKFLSLQPILDLEPCEVEEARSALENLIPQVPDVDEYEGVRREPTLTNVPTTTESHIDEPISPSSVAGC